MSSIPERIKAFNADREQAYVPLKYKLMTAGPFRFFRGTCHLFYEDLAAADPFPHYPLSWVCGDLHLENFGSFKGDNRLVYFDLNDFDEAILAPVTWELSRIVASIFVGFDTLQIKRREALKVAQLFLTSYSGTLASGRARYLEPRVARGIVRSFLTRVEERKVKGLLRQRTVETKGNINLLIDNKRLFGLNRTLKSELSRQLTQWLKKAAHPYRLYRVLDVAFRIAGTGSIGVKRYVFLMQHRDNPKKFMLVDMKQAKPSSLQPYVDIPQPVWTSEAERVVAIQERMESTPPALLNEVRFGNDSYVLKELQPMEDKINFMIIKDCYEDIECVIDEMGLITASAQLRSSGRQGSAIADELINFGRDTHWQQPLMTYAEDYAGQVKKDYRAYLRAYKSGFFSQGSDIRPQS
ncbi:MAG TPA: DUF2252 family protein [Puia sp.]|nr:DUF2252 family protein [Puia sp.]